MTGDLTIAGRLEALLVEVTELEASQYDKLRVWVESDNDGRVCKVHLQAPARLRVGHYVREGTLLL